MHASLSWYDVSSSSVSAVQQATGCPLSRGSMVSTSGLQGDVVYLGWPIAPSYIESKCGGRGGLRGLSVWVQLCTWSLNKLKRSNSIFNLWCQPSSIRGTSVTAETSATAANSNEAIETATAGTPATLLMPTAAGMCSTHHQSCAA